MCISRSLVDEAARLRAHNESVDWHVCQCTNTIFCFAMLLLICVSPFCVACTCKINNNIFEVRFYLQAHAFHRLMV